MSRQNSRSAAPLLVAGFLLIPALYIGSYFALVVPNGLLVAPTGDYYFTHYRLGCESPSFIFWPLEKIDRRVRPEVWKDGPVDRMSHARDENIENR